MACFLDAKELYNVTILSNILDDLLIPLSDLNVLKRSLADNAGRKGAVVMIKGILIALLMGVLTLDVTVSLAVQIKVGGGGAACKGFIAPFVEPFEDDTGVSVVIKPTTPAQGLIELNDGHVDIATAAVSFDEMIKGAARSGITIDSSLFNVKEIGSNKTLVFLHKSNRVRKLSKKQLSNIFTGKITNWNQVGGANQEIVVVWGIATPGQNGLFSRQILEDLPITPKRKEVTDYISIRDFVATNPGAIGIGPQGFAIASTNNPQIPLIISPVTVVTKKDASAESEKLLQYVKAYSLTP